jgi:hypothetical protein
VGGRCSAYYADICRMPFVPLRSVTAERLRNYAELAGTGLDGREAVGVSEATAMAIVPRTPSAEQLAEWQAAVEGVRQGDRSQWWPEMRSRLPGRLPPTGSWSPSWSTGGSAVHRPCWPARSLASSPSFGWIPPRPA